MLYWVNLTWARFEQLTLVVIGTDQGRMQDFKLGGAHLNFFGGYFVWIITIICQKIIFFPIAEAGANIFGVFRAKNSLLYAKKSYFF